MRIYFIYICLCCCLLSACDSGTNFAPVTDAVNFEAIPRAGNHRVRHGETLYEIAWRYGIDYRDLAMRNHMHSPYVLYTGQIIHLGSKPYGANSHRETIHPHRPVPVFQEATGSVDPESNRAVGAWFWPAKGKVANAFSAQNKGINIAGQLGQPIYAAAAGRVVYAGNGLRGYGNLVIVKHNSIYLSAYAHNNNLYVKEGNWVNKGQIIAGMGNTGTDRVMLHFEIRQAGKPVNPTIFYSETP
jgi:lipoprotein NlpD